MKGLMITPEIRLTSLEETRSAPYCRELKSLWYDREYLLNHLENIDENNWYLFDCGHIRWTVQEAFNARRECKNYPFSEFHYELIKLFTPAISFDTVLYTQTAIGGAPPHQDRNRPAALNFAIRGEFSDTSPQVFYDSFDRSTEKYRMTYEKNGLTKEFAPWIFKGPEIHGVENKTEKNRIIITCAWRHNSYEDIEKRLLDGTLVNWEQNEKNKRIKFV